MAIRFRLDRRIIAIPVLANVDNGTIYALILAMLFKLWNWVLIFEV